MRLYIFLLLCSMLVICCSTDNDENQTLQLNEEFANPNWTIDIDDLFIHSYRHWNNKVALLGVENSNYYFISFDTFDPSGTIIKRKFLEGFSSNSYNFQLYEKYILLYRKYEKIIEVYSSENLLKLFEKTTKNIIGEPVVNNNQLLFISTNNKIQSFNLNNGIASQIELNSVSDNMELRSLYTLSNSTVLYLKFKTNEGISFAKLSDDLELEWVIPQDISKGVFYNEEFATYSEKTINIYSTATGVNIKNHVTSGEISGIWKSTNSIAVKLSGENRIELYNESGLYDSVDSPETSSFSGVCVIGDLIEKYGLINKWYFNLYEGREINLKQLGIAKIYSYNLLRGEYIIQHESNGINLVSGCHFEFN